MKTLFTAIVLFISFWSVSKENYSIEQKCKSVLLKWFDCDLRLIKNSVGYTAPVAARTLAYISIGSYEAVVEILPENKSLSGQLSSFNRKTWNKETNVIDYAQVLNALNYKLALYYFENMPPSEKIKVDKLYKDLTHTLRKGNSLNKLHKSEEYGFKIAEEIILFSQNDGGDKGYSRNFPSSYVPPNCVGCWVKTYPGYKPALLPYWGTNQLLVESNRDFSDSLKKIPFSTVENSDFFAEAKKLSDIYLNTTLEMETIAEYWDDSAGISGTPAGHLFNLTLNLCEDESCGLQKSVELISELGIAINDAMVEAWKVKYSINLIRPISYIQQYIRKDFNTILETPPFPEFPSGHSVQAGVASEILNKYFPQNLEFIDSTNSNRKDIIGTPRKYVGFVELANEMSISRFYGGIHFKSTLDESLKFGKLIGINTIQRIDHRK